MCSGIYVANVVGRNEAGVFINYPLPPTAKKKEAEKESRSRKLGSSLGFCADFPVKRRHVLNRCVFISNPGILLFSSKSLSGKPKPGSSGVFGPAFPTRGEGGGATTSPWPSPSRRRGVRFWCGGGGGVRGK